MSEKVVGYLRELAETIVPAGRGSAFGPELAPAAGASAIDALAAFAGRKPLAS
jgi:hypothetical protein